MKKRIIIYVITVSLLISSLLGRLGYIAVGGAYAVNEGYNSFSVVIDKREYNLFYNDLKPLTNNVKKRIAVIKPNEKAVGELNKAFSAYERDKITEELKLGRPVVKELKKDISLKYIGCYYSCDTECTCKQLISKESSGLLTHIDFTEPERKVNYSVDALGRLLSGDDGTLLTDSDFYSKQGLALSLDSEIQKITYEACSKLKSGCAIVMDVHDSSILACVTKPDGSYINKPFSLYPAGSVFKIITSACALENGINPEYECTSSIQVGDTVYSCQKNKAHGVQTLESALANSCNCYFVNLALTLGADKLLKTVKEFGFDGSIDLYKSYSYESAQLPDGDDLKRKGELALLGFGQGKLLVTPAAICSALCTVADGGSYKKIRLVIGETDENGLYKRYENADKKKVMSASDSQTLLSCLRGVVESGTGRAADYNNQSAGKTATAQTGVYKNGREVLNAWFAGVYPYNSPKYAIVIMCEDGTSGAENCCPIFRTIVENLDNM